MRKEIIIHVGMPRTGTTYIQNNYFKQTPGLHYHRNASIEFEPLSGKNIWSNEDFSGKPYIKSKWDRYSNYAGLKRRFPDAKMILGLRNQEDLHRSMYTLFIKNGWIKSFDEAKEILEYKYNVKEVKELFLEVFEDNEKYIYHYEDFRRDNLMIVQEIYDFMEIDLPDIIPSKPMNVGWTEKQITFFQNTNKLINKLHLSDKKLFLDVLAGKKEAKEAFLRKR